MMLVTDKNADENVTSGGGHIFHSTPDNPPADLLASTPVATIVMPIARMMLAKSM